MIMNIYSVKDNVDGYFDQIIIGRSDDRFVQSFTTSLQRANKENESKGYPLRDLKDFSVYRLGTFDDVTGQISSNVVVLS